MSLMLRAFLDRAKYLEAMGKLMKPIMLKIPTAYL
jgi:hypothetical protein